MQKMMNKTKNIFQNNQLFFLFAIAVALTMLNSFVYMGSFTLIGILLLLILPVYYKAEDIDYLNLIFHYSEVTSEKVKDYSEKERLRQEERKAQQMEKQQQLEAEKLVKQIQQQKEMELKRKEKLDNILVQARKLMEENGMEEDEIEVALQLKRDEFEKETAIKQQQYEEKQSSHATQSTTNQPNDFQLEKKGGFINVLLILFGLLPAFIISSFILSFLDLDPAANAGIVIFLMIILVFDLFYFLPTLLYHSSTSGKILIYFLNIFLGATIIGWLLLLLFVLNSNKTYAYNQEILHHHRRQPK